MNIYSFEPVVREMVGAEEWGDVVDVKLAGETVWTDFAPSSGRRSDFKPDLDYSMQQFACRLKEMLS